jgi:hypothetical protein
MTAPADWTAISAQLKARADAGDSIAAALRTPLEGAGVPYSRRLGSGPLTETPEHIAWRGRMTAALVARDKLGRAVDGGPLTTVDPDEPASASTVVLQRLNNASNRATSGSGLAVAITLALKTALPSEPVRYAIDAARKPGAPTIAELEAAVRVALAPADAYIAAVTAP